MITSRFFRPIAICKTAETIGPTCLSSCSHVSDTSGSLCSTGHNCPPAATWLSSVCQVVGWEMLNPLWVWSIRNALLGWKKTATCSSTAIWGAVKSPSCSWSCSLPSISNKRTSWYSQVESFEVCPCYCFLQAKKKQDPDLCGEIQSFPPFEACLSAASALAFCQRWPPDDGSTGLFGSSQSCESPQPRRFGAAQTNGLEIWNRCFFNGGRNMIQCAL